MYESKASIIRGTEKKKRQASIHLKRKNTIFVYIISFYICVSFCLCEFVVVLARIRSVKLLSLAIYDQIVLPYIHIAAFTHKKYYLFRFSISRNTLSVRIACCEQANLVCIVSWPGSSRSAIENGARTIQTLTAKRYQNDRDEDEGW